MIAARVARDRVHSRPMHSKRSIPRVATAALVIRRESCDHYDWEEGCYDEREHIFAVCDF